MVRYCQLIYITIGIFMGSKEYLEIKQLLLEQRVMIDLLLPKKSSISFIVEQTGVTRQSIREYLNNNFIKDKDFWLENGKIFTAKATTIELLRKYNAK